MNETWVVLEKIIAMFVVLVVGYIARKRNVIDARVGRVLSAFTTDVALPALIFAQMLRDVDRAVLIETWPAAAMAAGVLLLGALVGWAGWRSFCDRGRAPTFIFVVSLANWIYLPLPIVSALYGDVGVRTLLLCNAGVQLMLWTAGIAVLRGGRMDRVSMLGLVKNPGLVATVAGVLLALVMPRPLMGDWPRLAALGGRSLLEGITMLGSLTIPLSLLVIGVQLGSMSSAAVRPGRAVWGVTLLRLGATPVLVAAIMWGMVHAGVPLDRLQLVIVFLMATMPVAVSCSILAERFGQDGPFAAQTIFYTTVVSLVTVPLAFWAFRGII